MKKFKLLTSLTFLGAIAIVTPIVATSFSSTPTVKATETYWTTDGKTKASKIYINNTYYLDPTKSEFGNANFAKELANKGAYKIENNGTDEKLGLKIETSAISITLTAIGTELNLKVSVTLNKEQAEYGKGGEGKKYIVTASIEEVETTLDMYIKLSPESIPIHVENGNIDLPASIVKHWRSEAGEWHVEVTNTAKYNGNDVEISRVNKTNVEGFITDCSFTTPDKLWINLQPGTSLVGDTAKLEFEVIDDDNHSVTTGFTATVVAN